MRLASTLCAGILLLGAAATGHAACVYQQAPTSLPNGAKATKDEMLAAQAVIKAYAASVQELYLPCLEKEKADAIAALSQADPAEYEKQKAALEAIQAKKHNAAIDELEATVARWNDEKKAFAAQEKK
jgi:hypothetical protein